MRMLLVGFFIISLFNLMVFFLKTIMKSNSGWGDPFLIQGDYIKHLSNTSQDNVKEGNLGNGHSQA